MRRAWQKGSAHQALPASTQSQFDFVGRLDSGPDYEYGVLVTNETRPIVGLAQLYRDRADCENVFDEIKNQWGWAGFVTRDLKRCRIVARLIALFYNWWNVFTRLAQTAEQLNPEASWAIILSAAFVKWLRGKLLRPVTHGNQVLLLLPS